MFMLKGLKLRFWRVMITFAATINSAAYRQCVCLRMNEGEGSFVIRIEMSKN